MMILSYFHLFS